MHSVDSDQDYHEDGDGLGKVLGWRTSSGEARGIMEPFQLMLVGFGSSGKLRAMPRTIA